MELNVELGTESADDCGKNNVETEETSKRGFKPEVGMEFESEEEAYKFYNEYAKILGFSIRRKHKNMRYGVIKNRTFCCSRSGFRDKDRRNKDVKKPRAETRTGCQAEMKVSLTDDGKYVVYKFEPKHNHKLVSSDMVHFLRSHRRLTNAQGAAGSIANSSATAPGSVMETTGKQAGGAENLRFMPEDCNNHLCSKREKQMQKGDAGALLEYFEMKQIEDSSFFYAIQLDEEELITNIFWADARMIVDYSYFGDVVCFDTTYKTNKSGRPFGLFVGVNHMKQTVVFGASLSYDETIPSFKWLFTTFAKAMSGRKPQTIMTDEDHAMCSAIKSVWPDTSHRFCLSHIYQNAAKHIHKIFELHKTFGKDFQKCIYEFEDDEEFVDAWNNMIKKYDLQTNEWLEERFKEREKWSLAYGRDAFCANMSTVHKSESMNSTLRRYLNTQKDLWCFLKHFDKFLIDRRYKEQQDDCYMRQSTPVVAGSISMLDHAKNIYTPAIFEMVHNEVLQVLNCHVRSFSEVGTVKEYRVLNSQGSMQRQHNVTFDSLNVTVVCSCKKFEFTGILCSHALKVLNTNEVMKIPDKYILKRWTKDAKCGSVESIHCGSNVENDIGLEIGRRYKDLCRQFVQIATKAAECKGTYDIASRYVKKVNRDVDMFLKHASPEESEQLGSVDVTTSCSSEDDLEYYAGEETFATIPGIKQKVKPGHTGHTLCRYKGNLDESISQRRKKSKDCGVVNNDVENLNEKANCQKKTPQTSNPTLVCSCEVTLPTPCTQESIGLAANSSGQSSMASIERPPFLFQNMCQKLLPINPNIYQLNHGQNQQGSSSFTQMSQPFCFSGLSRGPTHSGISFIQETRHSDGRDTQK